MNRLAPIALVAALFAGSAQAQKISLPGAEIDAGGFSFGLGWGLISVSAGEPSADGTPPLPEVPKPDPSSPEWQDAEAALKKNQEQLDRVIDAGFESAATALAEQAKVLSEVKRELASAGHDGSGDEEPDDPAEA